MHKKPKKIDFLPVTLMNQEFFTGNEEQLNELIFQPNPQRLLLAHHNLHSLYLVSNNSKMRNYFDRVQYIWIDGMPIIWILNALGHSIKKNFRTTFLDWQFSFFKIANTNQSRIFLLGGTLNTIEICTTKLSVTYPEIQFGFHHGYFDKSCPEKDENQGVLRKINEFNADILIVGMGMPIQEIWINQNFENINTKIVMPIGGYFDYIAGKTDTPPRWMGKVGLEWLYRLAKEPKRLGSRYLIEPWVIVYYLLSSKFNKKQ